MLAAAGIVRTPLNLQQKILAHPLARATLSESGLYQQLQNADPDALSTAVADYKEDGRQGRYDAGWVKEAGIANHTRRVGGFNEYETAKFDQNHASTSRELSEEEDEKRAKAEKRSLDRVEKFKVMKREDDNEGGSGGLGGKPLNGGAGLARGCKGLGSDLNNLPANGGNGVYKSKTAYERSIEGAILSNHLAPNDSVSSSPASTPKSNSPPTVGDNTSDFLMVYRPRKSPASDVARKTPIASTCHNQSHPLAAFGPAMFFPTPATPVLMYDPRLGMEDLYLQAGFYGLNQGQTSIAITNSLLAYQEKTEVLEPDFDDWEGRGYIDFPASKYPEISFLDDNPRNVYIRKT